MRRDPNMLDDYMLFAGLIAFWMIVANLGSN
jgi:hypothetical protein